MRRRSREPVVTTNPSVRRLRQRAPVETQREPATAGEGDALAAKLVEHPGECDAHVILNWANHKDIAETQDCTVTDVKAAWASVAVMVKNPPVDYRNAREVLVFKDDWRKLIMAMG